MCRVSETPRLYSRGFSSFEVPTPLRGKIIYSVLISGVLLLFNATSAFSICDDIIGAQNKGDENSSQQQGPACTQCKNAPRRGNLTKEPVLLQNGNLQLTSQDINIPGRGLSLDITRTYNAQLSSTVDGWAPEDGSGSWVVENGQYPLIL